jgi:hypothetical protein
MVAPMLIHFDPSAARAQRLKLGLRLIDVAYLARVAPATVRAFEFGAPVRGSTLQRLVEAYASVFSRNASGATAATVTPVKAGDFHVKPSPTVVPR